MSKHGHDNSKLVSYLGVFCTNSFQELVSIILACLQLLRCLSCMLYLFRFTQQAHPDINPVQHVQKLAKHWILHKLLWIKSVFSHAYEQEHKREHLNKQVAACTQSHKTTFQSYCAKFSQVCASCLVWCFCSGFARGLTTALNHCFSATKMQLLSEIQASKG